MIYDAPWANVSLNTSDNSSNSALMGPSNTAIVRYRPINAIGSTKELPKSGINDMRGLFAASNDFDTYGPYVLSKNSESRNIYSLFNTTRQDVEDATNDGVDRTNLNYNKLLDSLFESSGNDAISGPNKKCLGATFTFHAYVLKEGI